MPSPNHQAFSIDVATKTVTINQPDFNLHQDSLLPGYHHRIFATTMRIDDDCATSGYDLTISTAQIIVGKAGAKIDTSGLQGDDGTSPTSPDAIGVSRGLDGNPGGTGADGKDGGDAGQITINCAQIIGGALRLIGNGGDGGKAQSGGNGSDGGRVDAAGDAPFPRKVQVGTQTIPGNVKYTTAPVYGWGDDVDRIGHNQTIVLGVVVAEPELFRAHKAQAGLRGRNGGNAGLAGKPGNGGNAANIAVTTLRALPALPTITVESGTAGGKGAHGKPGASTQGGLGGHFLYRAEIGLAVVDWSIFKNEGGWKEHLYGTKHFQNMNVGSEHMTADGKGLVPRARSGADGTPGKWGPDGLASAPPVKQGTAGQTGQSATQVIVNISAPDKDYPLSYLISLQRSATIAIANRDTDTARVILEWVLFLSGRHAVLPADATMDQTAFNRIYRDAGQSVLTLGRDELLVEKANVYSDIDKYTDFVASSVAHLEKQSRMLADFTAATNDKTLNATHLTGAIDEARAYQRHLMGTSMEAGSINFLRSRESDIKQSIGTLDVDIFNLRNRLGQMDTVLQSAIDKKFHEQSKVTLEMVLEVTMMAVGIAASVYSFGSSLSAVSGQVKKFYLDKLDVQNWSEILKTGLFDSNFAEISADIGNIMDLEGFEKLTEALTKATKGLVKDVVDFGGKSMAYFEFLNSRRQLKTDMVDIQASVLTFDTAKLELHRQRAQLEADLHKLLDEFDEAREWRMIFDNFFHTCNTRFDNLAHLAELQAARREAEFQLGLSKRNEEALQAQLDLQNFNPESAQAQTSYQSLMSNHALATEQGLQRVLDMGRAYRAWSLDTHAFPKIPQNLKATDLTNRFYKPLSDKIKLRLSAFKRRSEQAMPARDIPRSLFPQSDEDFHNACFDQTIGAWRFNFSLPLGRDANAYHVRLLDIRAYPVGLTVADGTEVYCVLVHRGVSTFIDAEKAPVRTFQVPRAITYSFRTSPDGTRDTAYSGIVKSTFDDAGAERVRYSPYATWELRVHPDHQLIEGGNIYNQKLDWSAFERIEVNYSAYFDDRSSRV